MSRILDARRADYATIQESLDVTLNRSVDENRELTDAESAQVERDTARAETIAAEITHYVELENRNQAVMAALGSVQATGPTVTRTAPEPVDPDQELTAAFPGRTALGDYIVTVARAQSGDREAAERVERAVAHQTTADNPGLIPRPILGPVVDLMDSNRPFIASVTNRPLPASGQFDRPIITQPVKVDIQNGEKTELASQKMLIGKLPVAPDTFGGYVNISRQDIKRTTPGIMQIIAESFGTQYALRTDQAAVEAFIASILAVPILVTDWTAAEIMGAIFEAAAVPLSAHHAVALPDTLWVSTDVWGQLGSIVSPNGNLIFPSLTPNSTTGNVMGLKLVVDAYFPAGSGYLGSSRLVEWYEDVDGLVQVADVPLLGTQVGYSGDGAFLNTSPESFSKLSFPPITAAASASKSK